MQLVLNERTICTYNDLMRVMERLVDYEYKGKLKLVAAYPNENDSESLDLPIVTYRIRRKEPGKFGNNRELKPRHRDSLILRKVAPEIGEDDEVILGFKDKDGKPVTLEGGAAELWGQMFDYYIQFEVWADNNKLVEEWTLEFERFLFRYTGYLKARGVSDMFFQFREEGTQDAKWRTDLKSAKLEYLFRIDEVIGVRISEVENILMDVDVVDGSTQIVLNMLADYVGSSNEAYNKEVISHNVTSNI